MPELPELDVMQEVLTDRIVGRTMVTVDTFHPGILKTVDPGLDALVGKTFKTISRRGKHLILTVEDDLHLVVHLMLAGRLSLCQSKPFACMLFVIRPMSRPLPTPVSSRCRVISRSTISPGK